MTVLSADDARAIVSGLADVVRRLEQVERRHATVLAELGRLRAEVRAARLETAEAHGVALRAAADADAADAGADGAAEIAEVLASDARRMDDRLAAMERGAVQRSSARAAAIAGGILAAVEVWRALGR